LALRDATGGLFFAGALAALVGVLGIFLLTPLPAPPPAASYGAVFLDRDGRILRVYLSAADQWYLPPDPLSAVPAKLRAAVLRAEDRDFFRHPGFDPAAIVRAAGQNLRAGRIVSGASTITMQVARILDPKPRTLPAKALELLEAIRLELAHTKGDILRLYLEHAPYGGNVVGYRAAALRYFGKLPEALSWAECATLAVLPRAPGLVSPDLDSGALRSVRDGLLRDLRDDGEIDEVSYRASLEEAVPAASRRFSVEAPHFTEMLRSREGIRDGVVRTTLDVEVQHRVEETVRAQFGYLGLLGIRNAAAIVAETKTGRIRAYVGSQDFGDAAGQGQVDGVVAPRSSGSILKPFLYALAMDAGLLLPQTMIDDVPTHFGAFHPQNVGFTYSGLVSAQDALVRSLNVPAVRLLERYGYRDFYVFLRGAGMSTLFRPPEDYGLTLILGGAETTLYDLAGMYRGLARGGVFEGLRAVEGPSAAAAPSRLLSPGACDLTLDMLRELKRPGLEAWWRSFASSRPVAWKTGTSYGNRDAWALGVDPEWVVGIWVGNFSGEENANLQSASCSAPLLFDVLATLPRVAGPSWFARDPADVRSERICLDTGYVAGPDCPNTVSVPAPADAPPVEVCPYHRRVQVTLDGRYQVCSLCWTEGDHREASVLEYRPDTAQYLREQGRAVPTVPPHKPGCPARADDAALRIVYPQDGIHLILPREVTGVRQAVTARAAHRDEAETVFWYLDDVYLGSTSRRHTFALDLSPGQHRLEVIDAQGSRARVVFTADAAG
jgi:penicillin-binding protein 1C